MEGRRSIGTTTERGRSTRPRPLPEPARLRGLHRRAERRGVGERRGERSLPVGALHGRRHTHCSRTHTSCRSSLLVQLHHLHHRQLLLHQRIRRLCWWG